MESALRSAAFAEAEGLAARPDRPLRQGLRRAGPGGRLPPARRRDRDYPLHLGLTEAGLGMKGIVASSAALALLLQEGIGDTIRVSLTPAPGGDRAEEVRVAQQILQSLGLRSFLPQVTSCPGCGRTTSTFFQEMAQQIQDYLRDQMPRVARGHPGVAELRVAVMGCVVNGPGESKHAHLGISLPGTFEEPVAPVYMDGRLHSTLRGRRDRRGVPRNSGSLRGDELSAGPSIRRSAGAERAIAPDGRRHPRATPRRDPGALRRRACSPVSRLACIR